jgi:Ran GTPase-activating protein (RanGAP) involved in mRNA processing and transport
MIFVKNKTLNKFDISDNKLNNQDIEYIGRFIQSNPMLKEIDVCDCAIDTDGAIHLAKVLPESSLEKLDLNQNSIGDRGCVSLLSSIPPTLTDLSLNCNEITKSSLQTILTFRAANRTLRKLTISSNPTYFDRTDPNKYNDTLRQ